jgi:nucleoside-diphosphate-sugar epimerase
MNKIDQTILVTGGAGYVGSTFIRDALSLGYKVRCLDLLIYGGKSLIGFMNHPNFDFINGDIRNRKVIKDSLNNVTTIVHLAAIVGDLPCKVAPSSAYQINFEGTKLIADIAKEKGVKKFIFASTCSNYGVSDSSQYATETSVLNPVSLYAETKIDCERYLSSVSDDKFSTTCLRFATAFGTSFRTRFDLLVNSFAYEAWTTQSIVAFAADTWRPYIHVADMSRILLMIIKAPLSKIRGKIFNAGSTHQNYLKKDLVEILKAVMPELKTKYIDSIDDRRNYKVSFDKLENTFNFKPTISVHDGFQELLTSFKSGILSKSDYEANKLETLEIFFGEKEKILKR